MKYLPTVAICIPTFNQAKYLKQSVMSACQQTYSKIEIWVSDNASTDETPKVMSDLCINFSNINYYRQVKNLGAVGNQNWVLRQPETDFIVRLDSDDILAPKYVEILLSALLEYPKAGFAHCSTQEIDEEGEKLQLRRFLGRPKFQSFDDSLIDLVADARFCPTMMYKASALKAVNFYDERVAYAVDYDLSVRLADAGYSNVYIDIPLVYFRLWNDYDNRRLKRKETHLRDLVHIYDKALEPAFERHKLDRKIVHYYRTKTALIHSVICFSPIFTLEERKELVDLLKKLSNAPALRFRLWILGLGFYPLLSSFQIIVSDVKSLIRRLLYKLKHGPGFTD